MQELTPAAEQTVNTLAERYRVSHDAVRALLSAVVNGGGTMAQFYIPELGGGGQWMRGGMTMVGDMFNQGLQSTVAGLCSELSSLLASQEVFVSVRQASQRHPSGFPSYGNANQWWPTELGNPSSSGGQNDSRYAYFPGARRLAVEVGGVITIYDTLDHQIGGVQQQQGGSNASQSFTSQFGTFTVSSLPTVSGSGPPSPAEQGANLKSTSRFADSEDDVFAKLERLGALREKGVITDQEFQAKKSELLARV